MFKLNKRGSILANSLSLIVVGIALIIGIVVLAQVWGSIPSLEGTANTTATEIFNTTLQAFSLMTVALIVMAAAAIIAVLLALTGAR